MLEACAKDGLSGSETARVLRRTSRSVYCQAAVHGIRFNSADRASPRSFLEKGGVLIREEVGGAVGVTWGRAHRSGPGFEAAICERYVELGLLAPFNGSNRLFYKPGARA